MLTFNKWMLRGYVNVNYLYELRWFENANEMSSKGVFNKLGFKMSGRSF